MVLKSAGDVEIFGGKLAAIADYNAILSQQQDAFSAALPRARRVCAPGPLNLPTCAIAGV